MKAIIELTIGAFILSIPVVAFLVYFLTLNEKIKKVKKSFCREDSTSLTNLNVWVKNFDLWNKSKKFDLDLHGTTYDFNYCDLLINSDSLLVIGKTEFLGRKKYLNPTIFSRPNDRSKFTEITNRIVETNEVRRIGSDVELDFTDPNFNNEMTLVIKNISTETYEQIKQATTVAKSADVG